jgi:hypothetical protein
VFSAFLNFISSTTSLGMNGSGPSHKKTLAATQFHFLYNKVINVEICEVRNITSLFSIFIFQHDLGEFIFTFTLGTNSTVNIILGL